MERSNVLKGKQSAKIGKMARLSCLFFAILFFGAIKVQAEYLFQGVMKPGCGEIVRPKTTAKPTPKPSHSLGKSKSAVYLNLAQTLPQSPESKIIHEFFPLSSRSAAGSVSATKRTWATIPTVR